MLDPQLPVVADMPLAVREEITAFLTSLRGHWRKAWSTNPLSAESSGEEARRRRWDNPVALHRLSACVLIEVHDEWQVSERCYRPKSLVNCDVGNRGVLASCSSCCRPPATQFGYRKSAYAP